jgi:UDPglucose 6-dehydrogenase/GDP-mannose 6-dehydrogenase
VRVAIVGTGYVGLVTGACLAETGHEVTCVDSDPGRVAEVNAARSPIHEHGLDELLERHAGRRLTATTDLREAVLAADASLVAVGTPTVADRIDLTAIRSAVREIGEALADHPRYHVVGIKSTVLPGTTDDVVRPLLEEASGRVAGAAFGVGANPEFLTEGQAVHDFMAPDRVVLGGIDARTRQTLDRLYDGFPAAPRVRTTNTTAELIKYASNALLATLISFSNELANLATAVGGVDVKDVTDALHSSQYLTVELPDGSRRTAPIAAFLEAGCGFGGSCLPKDARALATQGRDLGAPLQVLEAVLDVNSTRPEELVRLLRRHHPSLAGRRVGVLGLAFKPGTDDVRESPAIPLVHRLLQEGAAVRVHDPAAGGLVDQVFPDEDVTRAATLEEAVDGADAVVLVTEWPEFAGLDLTALAGAMRGDLLVDGRNLYDPAAVRAAGLVYEGIGRGGNG